jgi:hypothetical protein
MAQQRDDVRLLAVFHWVLAGLAALFSLFPLLYLGLGVAMLRGQLDGPHPPPPFIGWMMIAVGTTMTLMGLGYAVLVALAGRWLAKNRNWTFIMVVAALSCAFFPFGTVLGVFTIIVLVKPEVKALFQGPREQP